MDDDTLMQYGTRALFAGSISSIVVAITGGGPGSVIGACILGCLFGLGLQYHENTH